MTSDSNSATSVLNEHVLSKLTPVRILELLHAPKESPTIPGQFILFNRAGEENLATME